MRNAECGVRIRVQRTYRINKSAIRNPQSNIPHSAFRIPHSNMPDWKKHVREHLPPLQLGAERELEIVEEFAQHLEAIYEDALAKGASEQEAYRRAVAQINDWQLLECEVSRAERPSAWLNQPTGNRIYREKGRINMGFLQDMRYGVRMLLKNTGAAAGCSLERHSETSGNAAGRAGGQPVNAQSFRWQRPRRSG
jgi:hypothetical protein